MDRLSNGRFFLGVGTGENINEGPMGYEFPAYPERIGRMGEALDIMNQLLAGNKVDRRGEYYVVDKAKLYSPPLGNVKILMAAGGPKSAAFAGANADGLITSVKEPVESMERVISPFRQAAKQAGKPAPNIMATRWVVLAKDDDEAWEALGTMRGLRAPGRLEVVDPTVLRQRADEMERTQILNQFTVVGSVEQLIDAYAPLVTEIGATHISIQVASVDPQSTIKLVGRDVLPELRRL